MVGFGWALAAGFMGSATLGRKVASLLGWVQLRVFAGWVSGLPFPDLG